MLLAVLTATTSVQTVNRGEFDRDTLGDCVGGSVGDIAGGDTVGDTVGDAVGDCVGDVVGDDVGDVVGEDVGASDVQHISAHSSAILGTMHWVVWRNNTPVSASSTSGKRGMFSSAHTGVDIGNAVGDTVGDDVGASDVQHGSAHSSTARDTMHWFVCCIYIENIGELRNLWECIQRTRCGGNSWRC